MSDSEANDQPTRAGKRGPRPNAETYTLFLDAAERLFATHGYEGTRVRAIAEASGANLGALHYYWGGKQALFKAVCERRLRPIVEERLRRYDQCVAHAGNGGLDLGEIIAATLGTALTKISSDQNSSGAIFGALMARTLSDPSPEIESVMQDIFDESSFRYVRLLRQCCTHLDDQAFFWRMHGVFGVAQYLYGGSSRMRYLSHGKFSDDDLGQGCREMTQFIVAGLLAPRLDSTDGTAKPKRKRTE